MENKAKEKVKVLIAYADNAMRQLNVGEAIDQCSETRLMYHLRDIYKAHGGAEVLIHSLPEDKDAKELWNRANELHKSGNISKDRFSRECTCYSK